MKLIISILLIIFLAPMIWSQTGTRLQLHELSHKQYNSEDRQKFKRKRASGHIDSTGVRLSFWNDCYLEINLLDKMLTNADSIKTRIINDQPAARYFFKTYMLQVYINKNGSLEIDARILAEPVSGRHHITFNIKSEGLRFQYTDTLSDADLAVLDSYAPAMWRGQPFVGGDKTEYVPDSVVGSYAVFRSDNKRDITKYVNNLTDMVVDSIIDYGTGKATEIPRPKAWDSKNDTVWCELFIDTIADTMSIIVPPVWFANAVFPVTIDPYFGMNDLGSSSIWVQQFAQCNRQSAWVFSPTSDNEDIDIIELGLQNEYTTAPWMSCKAAVYLYDGSDPTDLVSGTVSGNMTTASQTTTWYSYDYPTDIDMLDANTYTVAFYQIDGNGGKIGYEGSAARSQGLTASDAGSQVFPDPWSTSSGATNFNFSHRVTYITPSGGADPSTRRGKMIRKLGGIDETNIFDFYAVTICDWR